DGAAEPSSAEERAIPSATGATEPMTVMEHPSRSVIADTEQTATFGSNETSGVGRAEAPQVGRVESSPAGDLSLMSTDARRALSFAFREAERLEQRVIVTTHLLLGVARAGAESLSKCLAERGIEESRVRSVGRNMLVRLELPPVEGIGVSRNAMETLLRAQ